MSDAAKEAQELAADFWYEQRHGEGRGADYLAGRIEAALLAAEQRAWDLAHSPAKCGHARANWKDPRYGTPEYQGEERCEVCEQVTRAERRGLERAARLRDAASKFGARVFERERGWESETGTDLAEARDALTAAIRALRAGE